MLPNQLLLASIIAAHTDSRVVGRTRLQKIVYLLQRLGFPTRYDYRLFFYGPYSEALQAEVNMLNSSNVISEEQVSSSYGTCFVYNFADEELLGLAKIVDKLEFTEKYKEIAATESTILELAATYDAFLQLGYDREESLSLLHKKKGSKCNDNRDEMAIGLLKSLGLLDS